jgi:hypothetical protein
MEASRECTACHEIKPLTEFHRHFKNGFRPRCKPCRAAEAKLNYSKEYARQYYLATRADQLPKMKAYREANREKLRAYNKRLRRENPGYHRRSVLWRNYGITLEEWNLMFEAQGRACKLCQSPEPRSKIGWSTDHENTLTGPRVRGILCHHCNTGLGAFNHDPALLRLAANYL